jgi:hypothetical protein
LWYFREFSSQIQRFFEKKLAKFKFSKRKKFEIARHGSSKEPKIHMDDGFFSLSDVVNSQIWLNLDLG